VLCPGEISDGGTRQQAMEITIKMDNGQLIAIVQEGDPLAFRSGDRVRIISSGGESRVTH